MLPDARLRVAALRTHLPVPSSARVLASCAIFLCRHSRSTESRPLWSSCQVQSWDQRLSEPGSRSSTKNSMPSSSAVETAACAALRACLPEVTFHSGSCRLGLSITLPEISGYPSLRNALWQSSEPENNVLSTWEKSTT